MTTPILRSDWTLNFPALANRPEMPHSIDDLVYASPPDILGNSEKIDDFSAKYNLDGSMCPQGVLEFIPYGNPEDSISSRVFSGDIAVYTTPKPSPFADNRDGIIAAIKQRGFHAELCYTKNQQAWNASVWGDGFKDRRMSDLSDGFVINIYRLKLPSGPVAQSQAFYQSVSFWKLVYDQYNIPPNDFRWYLDPADFSSRDGLAQMAKTLLNVPSGTNPNLPPVTCVQWVYTVFCLALLFPPSEQILTELGMLESYAKNWRGACGELVEINSPFCADFPFKPYSPAQMIQAFLNTYCNGVDLINLLRSGDAPTRAQIQQCLQSGCPPEYLPQIEPYLQRIEDTGDPTIQLDQAPNGFIMPSCFICEERKPRQAQNSCWFEYVGTAMQKSLLTQIAK